MLGVSTALLQANLVPILLSQSHLFCGEGAGPACGELEGQPFVEICRILPQHSNASMLVAILGWRPEMSGATFVNVSMRKEGLFYWPRIFQREDKYLFFFDDFLNFLFD